MSYSDTSDAQYGLQSVALEQQQLEEKKQKDFQNAALVTRNLWDMYSTEAQKRTKEMLGMMVEIPDPDDPTKMIEVPAYEYDPQYMEGGFLKRQFTPGGGRVQLTTEGQSAVDAGTIKDVQGAETFGEYLPKEVVGKEKMFTLSRAGTKAGKEAVWAPGKGIQQIGKGAKWVADKAVSAWDMLGIGK